jgi:hypothetical protein
MVMAGNVTEGYAILQRPLELEAVTQLASQMWERTYRAGCAQRQRRVRARLLPLPATETLSRYP